MGHNLPVSFVGNLVEVIGYIIQGCDNSEMFPMAVMHESLVSNMSHLRQ